jgi:hypothetical protein
MCFRKRNQKAREHPNQWLYKVQFSQSVFPPHRLTISDTFMLRFFTLLLQILVFLMRLIPQETHKTTPVEVYLSVMLMQHSTIYFRRVQQNPFILMHLNPFFCSYQELRARSHLARTLDDGRAVCKPLTT